MVVDSSAWVAILRDEPDAPSLLETITNATTVHVSAASYVEVGAVIDAARNPIASRRFDELLELYQVVIEPVTPDQARRAREAYRDFGRGRGHPARLNYGDVFSYALATDLRAPLLFKGDDFTHTDVIDARA
ncbi:MAG: type II toxin-antitoxin system VapC family toxin [Trueperaceae bacterium]